MRHTLDFVSHALLLTACCFFIADALLTDELTWRTIGFAFLAGIHAMLVVEKIMTGYYTTISKEPEAIDDEPSGSQDNLPELRQKALEIRFLAMKKGLTNRKIAKALGCHEDLVSKAFQAKRIAAFKRVERYVRYYRPRAPHGRP